SVNELIDLGELIERVPELQRLAPRLQQNIGIDVIPGSVSNEFSGRDYRVINFVADLPVRIDSFVNDVHQPMPRELRPIVFLLAEFQLVDQRSAARNKRGDLSHQKYKERQKQRVKERLIRTTRPATPAEK